MLYLRTAIEDWRESLGRVRETLSDSEEDKLAEALRDRSLARLSEGGVAWQRGYEQSRGSYVIVQGGTAEEVALLDEIIAQVNAELEVERRQELRDEGPTC